MREVAKSFLSFSWALSVLGLEELTNLVSEERSGDRSERISKDFDSVTDATGKRFSERAQSMFEAGDRLQREVVDLFFDALKAEEWKPDKVFDRMADFAESTADALRDARKESEDTEAEEEGEDAS